MELTTWDPKWGKGLAWFVAASHPQDEQAGVTRGNGEGICLLRFLHVDAESEQNEGPFPGFVPVFFMLKKKKSLEILF